MMVLSIGPTEIEVNFTAQQQFDYENLGGLLKGPLDHILSVLSDQSKTQTTYGVYEVAQLDSGLMLTKFLLRCIAESWGMSSVDLRKQSWYLHYKDNALYGDLRRI